MTNVRSSLGSSDADLVARHRYGDETAFEELYQRFGGLVYNLALRQCGDPDRAQDLSQEIFLRIYRSLGKFKGRSTLKTWIYRICINHCRTHFSRRRLPTESLTTPEGPDRELVDESRGPEEHSMARDAGRQVAKALVAVDDVFREAVALRDLEGLSYREIAEVLGVKVGTVRSRIARGRDQLKRLLEKDESSEH